MILPHWACPREKRGRALRFYSSPDARIPCAHAIRVRGNRCDPSRKILPHCPFGNYASLPKSKITCAVSIKNSRCDRYLQSGFWHPGVYHFCFAVAMPDQQYHWVHILYVGFGQC